MLTTAIRTSRIIIPPKELKGGDRNIKKVKYAGSSRFLFQAKGNYDATMDDLNKIQKTKQELQKQEPLKAIEASPRSYDEIIKFLAGKSDSDDE